MDPKIRSFWKKYLKSNELERLDLIKSLPIFISVRATSGIAYITPSSLKAYCDDIIEALVKDGTGKKTI